MPLALVGGRRDPLSIEAIELLVALAFVVDPLQQLHRLGLAGDGLQRLAQRSDGVLGVPRLMAAPRNLVVDGGGALDAVGADPVGVRVDGRQQLQRLLVAGPQANDLGQPLGRGVELLELLAEDAPEAEQQVGAPAGFAGPLQLQLVEADDRRGSRRARGRSSGPTRSTGCAPARASPGRCGLRTSALQLREVVEEELAHLRFQLGDAGWCRASAPRRPPPAPASSCSRRCAPARDRCP